MVVIILERVSPSLRGELTRWMLEPKPGVFVGKVSPVVRERLWDKACKEMKAGAGLLLFSSDSEQGFSGECSGLPNRLLEDFEGLLLVRASWNQ